MAIKISSSSVISTYPELPQRPVGFEAKLPWLCKTMHLSSDPNDYFFFPVPILYSDLPNRNGVGFPLQELLAWNPDLKCQAYEGWRFAPMFEEHRSDDIEKSIGVVADVALTPIKGFGAGKLWKVMALAAIDRTKDRDLASQVESGKINTYSMGAMVGSFYCSYCGKEECSHIDPDPSKVNFYELNGKLVYKLCRNISPYELSVVRDPAFLTAISDAKITLK